MGIFKKQNNTSLFNKLDENRITPQAGYLLAAITLIAIDGDIDEKEKASILRVYENSKPEDWDSAIKAWKIKSKEECIALSANSMDKGQQLVAITNLIDIAMADGILAKKEQDLLDAYVKAFSVSKWRIMIIRYVISIKNRKSVFWP